MNGKQKLKAKKVKETIVEPKEKKDVQTKSTKRSKSDNKK